MGHPEFFIMPDIQARQLPVAMRGGLRARFGERVAPRLLVLPQGWSWSHHLCQGLVEHCVDQSGLDPAGRLRDHVTAFPLRGDNYAHAQCMENLQAQTKRVTDVQLLLNHSIEVKEAYE